MSKTLLAAALAVFFVSGGQAGAQEYPNRPITMIIPFAAGGPADVFGRVLAQGMSDILGKQVIVENVGGAGGMTGGARTANASPDGYNFLLGTVGTQAQSQTMYKKPLYDSTADFTPAGLLAEVPIILIVRKDLPATDFKEFVAYTKANKAKMQFGSAGAGSATHLGCVLLNYLIDADVTHVPYRGTGPAMQDLIGGRIDYLCEVITTAKPQVDGGSVRALAIFDKQRSPAMPDLPTAIEEGTKDLIAYTWYGMFFPKGTPDAIITKINATALQALKNPGTRAKLQELGAQFVSDDRTSPKYLGEFLKDEIKKWAVPIKAANVQVE